VLRKIAAQSANFIAVDIFVSWFVGGPRCSASRRIDVRASYVAHAMGWRTRSRTGRDTKAPGSIPAGRKQVRACASSQSSSLLPYAWRAILWMDPAAREPGALTRADEVIE